MTTTIHDVARKAGVSHAAVSDILNRGRAMRFAPETVERVRKAAACLGYETNRFAQSLKNGKTGIIGIVNPDRMLFNYHDPYFADIFMGLAAYFAGHDYKLMFLPLDNGHNGIEQALGGRLADGLVYVLLSRNLELFKKEHAPRLKRLGVPVVVVHSMRNVPGFAQIGLNCEAGGHAAAEHLIAAHGFRDVCLVTSQKPFQHHVDLETGFQKSMKRHGLPQHVERLAGYGLKDGQALVDSWMAQKKALPRAIVTISYQLAVGIVRRLITAGIRVPEEVALVSFGENVGDYDAIGMTLIEQPARLKGTRAGELLLTLIKAPKAGHTTQKYIFKPKLIINQSCGCKVL
jgi:LacI family transcriptional regulator